MSADDGAAAFRRAAAALNEAADKELRKQVYAAFRRAAKPLGEKIIKGAAAELPHRGGLSARIASAQMRQSNSTKGRNPGVALSFRTKPSASGQSYDLKTIDAGKVRHPVFARPGHKPPWRVTKVKPGAFRRPFDAGAEPVGKEVVRAMQAVADQIARNSNRG